jgi:DNA repair protein RAD5
MMCPVCLDKIDDAMVTCCLHVLCRLCAHGILTNSSQCPYCRRYLTKDDLMTLPRESSFSLDWRKEYKRSSKL